MKNNKLKILLFEFLSSFDYLSQKSPMKTEKDKEEYGKSVGLLVDNYEKKIMNKIQRGEL